jgi:CheY-like chemotaxis protein
VTTCCREAPQDATLGRAARHIVMDLDAPRHHVRGDPARLQQVMWNLIKNAMKFTPRDGVITVRTRNDELRAGHVERGELVIDVIDTGSGIAPEMLPKVFEAFEQGEAEPARTGGGLGLGLSISKGLVESHGGRIAVRSDGPGRGATFTVRLPAIDVPAELPAPRGLPQAVECSIAAAPLLGGASDNARRPHRVRILLVEDHPDTYVAMQRLLRLFGHDVKGARNLADALTVAADGEFDVLLSDIGLPDGTGLDLIRELRARESNGHRLFKGIALTGFGMAEDQRRAHEAGFDAHLTKPVDIEVLRETIERLSPLATAETADERG